MNYKLEIYGALCSTSKFEINGKRAESSDFGTQRDEDSENAPEYCCGNMQFTPGMPTQKILDKYGITVDEFNKIAEELAKKLSFGSCGWCS